MDDEVVVRVAHRVADLVHEVEPLIDGEIVGVAVAAQVRTVDRLHREVREPRRRETSLDEPRDARVLQEGEDAPSSRKRRTIPGVPRWRILIAACCSN